MRRVAIGTLLAATVPLGAAVPPVQAAACYTPDGVYAGNGGASASGTLYWNGPRSGSYSVRVSNTRDGKSATLFVQFLKHGIGWVDRLEYRVADGATATFSNVFSKSYQVDMVSFGIGNQDQREYQIVWDRNSACGA